LKILFAIKSMDGVGGGAERVLADVTSGLVELGHGVSILTYDRPNGKSFYPIDSSINRISLSIGSSGQRSTACETLQRILAMRRSIVEINPDIVVGFMHSMFIPLGIALAGTRIPVIASEHIGVEHYKYHPLEYLLLQLTPYFTKKIVVISENLRNGFNGHLKKDMTVISNPVSVPKISPGDQVDLNSSQKVILSVGRLVSQKDHKTLIDAYAMLVDDFPDWNLRIFGDGELRSELEAQINKLTLEERIQLLSTTPDIGKEYLSAQIFVVPSLYESFGLATAEALVYGLPAIGFADCPGTNEVIKHDQNGVLVLGERRNVVLAKGLRRLMSSPDLRKRLGDAGPDSMADFSKEKICDKWEKLLQEL
jgi:GalNAc-alpha-(1->4)-GalNAc-alpha-(1->3)-diNAcBac-PP-undecaprenol alpha-1,4-N-acetyl-D-galactosaminyltransferase